jgi:hypothetical protein
MQTTKRGLVQDASSFLYLAQDKQNETDAGPIFWAITERNICASQEIAGNYERPCNIIMNPSGCTV